jgi:galactose-1-phosphate uridylyltransferase
MDHIIEYNLDLGKTKPDNVHHDMDYCPFCDVEHLTNIMDKRGSMIWLENKYPVLKDAWQTVIIETDQCKADFSTYSLDYATHLVSYCLEKWRLVEAMERFKTVVYYRNHGFMSGGTIRHPHSQIVGFEKYDYHDDIKPFHLQGIPILEEKGLKINLSTHPIIGFYEVNLVLQDQDQLQTLVKYMQRTSRFLMNCFNSYNDSYNIFFYDFPHDDSIYVKMIPRFLTNPLYVGYMIPQVANEGHTQRFIHKLRQVLLEQGKD